MHWGETFTGLAVAIMIKLLLIAISASLGFTTITNTGALRSDASEVDTVLVIWSIINLFISLFVGSRVTFRSYPPYDGSTSNLNGSVFLWRLRWRSRYF